MGESVNSLIRTIRFSDFSASDLLELEQAIGGLRRQLVAERGLEVRNQKVGEERTGPHCGSTRSIKCGQDAHGQQRYRCVIRDENGCGKTYTALTGTAFSGMKRRDQWGSFIVAMSKGFRSINELHESGEVKVNRRTLWRFRHRYLRALEESEPTVLSGVVEADETYFRDSFKGSRGWKRGNPHVDRAPRRLGKSNKRGLSNEHVPVITAIDRQRQQYHQVLANQLQMEHALKGRIEEASVLCSDGRPNYRRAAFYNSLHHIEARNKEKAIPYPDEHTHEVKQLSLAHVNNLHQTMKNWVNERARGVSTAYLSHYLTWLVRSNREHLENGTVYEVTKHT